MSPTPDALAALREAEERAAADVRNVMNYVYFASETQVGIDAAVAAYRDAVAGCAREEMRAGATPLWVATEERGGESEVSALPPSEVAECGDLLYVRPALTPPGTVRRAWLVVEEPDA